MHCLPNLLSASCLQQQRSHALLGWLVDPPPDSKSWHATVFGGLAYDMVGWARWPASIPNTVRSLVVPFAGTFCRSICHRFDDVGTKGKLIFETMLFCPIRQALRFDSAGHPVAGPGWAGLVASTQPGQSGVARPSPRSGLAKLHRTWPGT